MGANVAAVAMRDMMDSPLVFLIMSLRLRTLVSEVQVRDFWLWTSVLDK